MLSRASAVLLRRSQHLSASLSQRRTPQVLGDDLALPIDQHSAGDPRDVVELREGAVELAEIADLGPADFLTLEELGEGPAVSVQRDAEHDEVPVRVLPM